MKPLALWLGFAAMCLGMFMAVLDIQVVDDPPRNGHLQVRARSSKSSRYAARQRWLRIGAIRTIGCVSNASTMARYCG